MALAIGKLLETFLVNNQTIALPILWVVSRFYMATGKSPGWRFGRLAKRLDYRVPVKATLGNGLRAKVPWADVAGQEICATGWYEPETVTVLQGLLAPGMTFVDIGAAFGQYTLLAAKIVGDSGHVFAFEPESESFAWLDENVRMNRLANVSVNRVALGESDGSAELYIGSPTNLGTTSLREQYNFSGRMESVPIKRLDSYLEDETIARVDVIKIDVEGAELSVFKGAEKILQAKPAIIIEFEETNQARFGSSCAELAIFFRSHGYELRSMLDGRLEPYTDEHPQNHYSFNVLATQSLATGR